MRQWKSGCLLVASCLLLCGGSYAQLGYGQPGGRRGGTGTVGSQPPLPAPDNSWINALPMPEMSPPIPAPATAATDASMPKPLPAEYRILATTIGLPLTQSLIAPASNKKVPELIATLKAAVMDLKQIHATDDQINELAVDAIATLADVAKRIEAIDMASMTKPGPAAAPAGAIIEGIMGLAEDNPLAVVHALSKDAAAQEQQNAKNASWQQAVQVELAHFVDDSNKLTAIQILLPKIAAKYSAAPAPNSARIGMVYMAAWGPLGNNDVLRLVNPGPDLENCTITVQVAGANGDKCTNVHFVPKWSSKTILSAMYSPGIPMLGHTINQTTLSHAQTVVVLIQSPKYSTVLRYNFNAKEQDKYVAGLCAKLKFSGIIYQASGLFGATNSATLTLDGATMIPKGQAELTLHTGTKSQVVPYNFDPWKKGEAKSFPNLPFKPDSIDIKLVFPDTGYTYQGKVVN